MEPPNNSSGRKRAVILLLLLPPIAMIARAAAENAPLFEDGYYYLQLAHQVSTGGGLTLDGAAVTNGFQPLWLLLLLPAAALAPNPSTLICLAIIVQAALLVGTMWLGYLLLRRRAPAPVALAGVLMWLLAAWRLSFSGLEFGLGAFLLAALALSYDRQAPKRGPLTSGLLAALASLARLDYFLLAGLLGVALLAGAPSGKRWRTGVRFSGPVLAAGAGYLAWNWRYFGEWLPVSGAVKHDWSVLLLSMDPVHLTYGGLAARLNNSLWPLRQLPALWPLLLLGGLMAAVVLIWTRSRWWPWALFAWLQYGFYAAYLHGELTATPWYYLVAPALIVAGAVSGWWRLFGKESTQVRADMTRPGAGRFAPERRRAGLVNRIAATRIILPWLPPVLVSAVFCLQLLRPPPQSPLPLVDAANWVRQNLPEAAVVGAWNAGAISFYSERRTINLDGLVNTPAFAARTDLCRYWEEAGVTHIVDIFDDRWGITQPIAPVPVYDRYAACAGRLRLIWRRDYPGMEWHVAAYALDAAELKR